MKLTDIAVNNGPKGLQHCTDLEEWRILTNGYSVWVGVPDTTNDGNVYFKSPGVALLSKPEWNGMGLHPFLAQFDKFCGEEEPKFAHYLDDQTKLPGAEQLCKFAGQLCYLSLGPKRTKNGDAEKYFTNILNQSHGSVLEHANFSMLFWGISRSLTHELVRHRAGFAYSQVSQRYVDGSRLRFVQRPEFTGELFPRFMDRVDEVAAEYNWAAETLMNEMGDSLKDMVSSTDRRKAVNQAARAILPNETEAPIVATANVRAWRHFLNMRGSLYAEPEIRRLAIRVLCVLHTVASKLFQDFEIRKELSGGRIYLHTDYPKV